MNKEKAIVGLRPAPGTEAKKKHLVGFGCKARRRGVFFVQGAPGKIIDNQGASGSTAIICPNGAGKTTLLVGLGIMAVQRYSTLSSDTVIGVSFSGVVAFGLDVVSRDWTIKIVRTTDKKYQVVQKTNDSIQQIIY